jgi:hypothetical protein
VGSGRKNITEVPRRSILGVGFAAEMTLGQASYTCGERKYSNIGQLSDLELLTALSAEQYLITYPSQEFSSFSLNVR